MITAVITIIIIALPSITTAAMAAIMAATAVGVAKCNIRKI